MPNIMYYIFLQWMNFMECKRYLNKGMLGGEEWGGETEEEEDIERGDIENVCGERVPFTLCSPIEN